MSNVLTESPTQTADRPAQLRGWKDAQETLEILRVQFNRPRLHISTLNRIRQRREIEAFMFGHKWYYKPETVGPQSDEA